MKTKSLGMRLPVKVEEEIDRVISAGLYLSRGEFIREALREKLQSIEFLEIRQVSRTEARKAIQTYLAEYHRAWTSEIADALRLDIDVVLSVLADLRAAGMVVEDDDA